MFKLKLPRVVSVKQKTLTGSEKEVGYFSSLFSEAKSFLTDHEVRILILWAIISPSAAIAYLIWKKYEKLKWLAVVLFVVSLFQFVGQWGGVAWAVSRVFGVY